MTSTYAPYFFFRCSGAFVARGDPLGPAPGGVYVTAQINAPPGITITGASAGGSMTNINNGSGWVGGSFAAGSGGWWPLTVSSISSNYWGFGVQCAPGWSCNGAAQVTLSSIIFSATETQSPSLSAMGTGNLWYQSGAGEWIWNAPGDPWPLTLAASDPSGVCRMYASIGNTVVPGPSALPDTSQWQQCPEPTWTPSGGASVDTRDFVPTAGSLPLQINATNAAGLTTSDSETLHVDNDPVTVSLSTPNDTTPSAWVNHPVTLVAVPGAGPSGVGGMNCGIDGGPAKRYTLAGVHVDGDGVHTVSCTAWNNAIDPHGRPSMATSSVVVHIDEVPPSLTFEPQIPVDPTRLTVAASDSESGVAGGSLEIAPAGTNAWRALPTSFDGHHLLTALDDAGLHGEYTVQATACDNVGNCASTVENLKLPLRIAAASEVSFVRIVAPAVVVRRRVRVGWHWARVRRHRELVHVKRGGHYIMVPLVIRRNATCGSKRVRTGPHRWREVVACRPVKIHTQATELVGHDKPATVHGVLITGQGVPVANAPVQVIAAPDNGLKQFTPVTTVATNQSGAWTATLPPGPSRIIQAVYGGSATLLPANGTVHMLVPARVRLLSVSPRHVPWGGTVRIVGQLDGGYLPPGGALVRLRIGYGPAFTTYGVKEHVTGNGRFTTTYTFGLGEASVSHAYWFQIASLPMGDYPWAPADSRRLGVTVGG